MVNLKTSQDGVDLVKAFEGLHKVKADGNVRAYRCPAGKWTIGWGHTKAVRSGMVATVAECEMFLREDLTEFEDVIKRYVKVPLTQNQFDALVSFAFNVGEGNFKSSTLLRRLNSGFYDDVPAQLMRWNKARVEGVLTPLAGLTRRRAAEAAMFSMDTELASRGGEPMPQKVEQGEAKPLTKSRTMAGLSMAGVSTALGEASTQLQALAPYSTTITTVFVVLTVIGIAIAAYARYDDHREGKR